MRSDHNGTRRLAIEAAAFGLGYAAVLCWAGTALVGSVGRTLSQPYWPAIPWLRTDTTGVLAFFVAAVCLVISKYLRLQRSRGPVSGPFALLPATGRPDAPARPPAVVLLQAVAETAAILGTGLVIYLSLNAVSHPYTLQLQLTHLWPWPSEGTVRVIGLVICVVAVALTRYLRAAATRAPQEPGAAITPADDRIDAAA